MSQNFTDIFFSAGDGLRLHARCWGPRNADSLPVVCLPGLARTSADFNPIARALSEDKATPRRVVALDYRGRGLSDYDCDPANYTVQTELADVLAAVAALELSPAIFIGTSRGGILAMLLAAIRPSAVAAAVLNDIGPVIEPKGLMRIKSYVGKLPQPKDFEDAAHLLRRLFDAQFPRLTAENWLESAHKTFKIDGGRLVPTYDVRLALMLSGVALDRPLPALWRQFDALAHVPVLVVRGALSDILSAETVAAMRARHTSLETIEVAEEGHAPLLADRETIARIIAFVATAGSPAA